jgi:hypothetical protein
MPSPKFTLTIEGLHRHFHNKPSPFELETKSKKSPQTAPAAQSLNGFFEFSTARVLAISRENVAGCGHLLSALSTNSL